MAEISFLCGLGNPGEKYRNTRHNLGFATLDLLALNHRLGWKGRGGVSLESRWRLAGRVIVLVKPQTWMNASGEALSAYPDCTAENLLVICDDINLPMGVLRIRERGGSGGHKGLESVTGYLGTDNFARLRIGVGPAPAGEEWSDFVLEPIPEDERETVSGITNDAARAVETVLRGGIEAGQREFNRPAGGV